MLGVLRQPSWIGLTAARRRCSASRSPSSGLWQLRRHDERAAANAVARGQPRACTGRRSPTCSRPTSPLPAARRVARRSPRPARTTPTTSCSCATARTRASSATRWSRRSSRRPGRRCWSSAAGCRSATSPTRSPVVPAPPTERRSRCRRALRPTPTGGTDADRAAGRPGPPARRPGDRRDAPVRRAAGGYVQLVAGAARARTRARPARARSLVPEPSAGPHLPYAIQWFLFGVIAIGGWVVLLRARPCEEPPARDRTPMRSPTAGDGGAAMSCRIEDYGLIGDMQSAALVGRDGSIDWLCLPRFDSGACFAGLLGDDENGHWRLAPAGGGTRHAAPLPRRHARSSRPSGRPPDGVVRVIDFMPPRHEAPDVVRIVEGVRGRVPMSLGAAAAPRLRPVEAVGAARRRAVRRRRRAGRAVAALRRRRSTDATSRPSPTSRSSAGERVRFVLTWHPSHLPAPDPVDPFDVARADRGRSGPSGSAAVDVRGRVARRGRPVADHAQGAHVRSRPAASSRRRPPRCPRTSAACATGTTATAGCATRP